MTRLPRRYRYSASHRLHTASLGESQNRELYGKCNNPHSHGHNYELEVSVKGCVDAASGLLIRIEELDRLVTAAVVRDLDHRNLNLEVAEFASKVPTTENLARVVASRLEAAWKATFGASGAVLDRVRIRETKNNSVELKV